MGMLKSQEDTAERSPYSFVSCSHNRKRQHEDSVSWLVFSEKGSCTAKSSQWLTSHFQSQELQRRLAEASSQSFPLPVTQTDIWPTKRAYRYLSVFKNEILSSDFFERRFKAQNLSDGKRVCGKKPRSLFPPSPPAPNPESTHG